MVNVTVAISYISNYTHVAMEHAHKYIASLYSTYTYTFSCNKVSYLIKCHNRVIMHAYKIIAVHVSIATDSNMDYI